MKQGKNVDSILVRLNEAEQQKDWGEMAEILDDATKGDVGALRGVIPRLAAHRKWLIRTSTMEVIGDFRLRSFLNVVKGGLEDKHPCVKAYALMAYYDLLHRKALLVIEEFCRAKSIGLRVTALALHYVETRREDVWKALTKILKRSNCFYMHRHKALNVFEHYLDISEHPEIVDLFQGMLRGLPRWHGLYKDIKQRLRVWRLPNKRKQKKQQGKTKTPRRTLDN